MIWLLVSFTSQFTLFSSKRNGNFVFNVFH
uniref:Uncharacterized protein n=1 Tax=Anguilla anguilla TaxID=7936 RepID=A0A0E9VMH0_ANGAN